MTQQTPIIFSGIPRRELHPREPPNPSPKRNRAPTATDQNASTLPPNNRPRVKKAPSLKPTNAFLFTGLHPLYTRTVYKPDYCMMWVFCSQLGCTNYERKLVNRSLAGTNNYKSHYLKYHPGVPLSQKELDELNIRRKSNKVLHYEKPVQSNPKTNATVRSFSNLSSRTTLPSLSSTSPKRKL